MLHTFRMENSFRWVKKLVASLCPFCEAQEVGSSVEQPPFSKKRIRVRDFIIKLIELNISSTVLGCIVISKMFKLSMTTGIVGPCEVVLGTQRRAGCSVQQAKVPCCQA